MKICSSLPRAAQEAPREVHEAPKAGQVRSKIGPRTAQEPPRAPKEAPRSGPGTAPERPGAAQEWTRGADAAGEAPGGPKEALKRPPRKPKELPERPPRGPTRTTQEETRREEIRAHETTNNLQEYAGLLMTLGLVAGHLRAEEAALETGGVLRPRFQSHAA